MYLVASVNPSVCPSSRGWTVWPRLCRVQQRAKRSHYQSEVVVCVSNNRADAVDRVLIWKLQLVKLVKWPRALAFDISRMSYFVWQQLLTNVDQLWPPIWPTMTKILFRVSHRPGLLQADPLQWTGSPSQCDGLADCCQITMNMKSHAIPRVRIGDHFWRVKLWRRSFEKIFTTKIVPVFQ